MAWIIIQYTAEVFLQKQTVSEVTVLDILEKRIKPYQTQHSNKEFKLVLRHLFLPYSTQSTGYLKTRWRILYDV
jgi:hypothetical protein